jgi:hypothetical protein
VAVRFSLHQFSEVFRIRDAHGRPYILVGGQAVNYWAERYLPTEPALRPLLPFTSEDIDFRGNREDVQRVAEQLNQRPIYPPKVAMTALAGAVPFRIGELESNIEIVRQIPGVTAAMVEALAIETEWSGRQLRVLDPLSLLACKLELAFTVPQAKRRDVAHLRMLVTCVRGFLRELLAGVEEGGLPAKGWLGAANRLMQLSKTTRGRKAASRFGIHWTQCLPLPELGQCLHPKIVRFREQQLARWLAK